MNESVLHAAALLALWFQEAGSERIESAVTRAMVSTVNLSEAYAKYADKRGDFAPAQTLFEASDIQVVAFGEDLAVRAATLRARHPRANLSFADRACLALAMREDATALTSDKLWSSLAGVGRGEQFR